MEKTFERWIAKVNEILSSQIGLTTDDLPDQCYMDMFEDDVSPSEAAKRAISEA